MLLTIEYSNIALFVSALSNLNRSSSVHGCMPNEVASTDRQPVEALADN